MGEVSLGFFHSLVDYLLTVRPFWRPPILRPGERVGLYYFSTYPKSCKGSWERGRLRSDPSTHTLFELRLSRQLLFPELHIRRGGQRGTCPSVPKPYLPVCVDDYCNPTYKRRTPVSSRESQRRSPSPMKCSNTLDLPGSQEVHQRTLKLSKDGHELTEIFVPTTFKINFLSFSFSYRSEVTYWPREDSSLVPYSRRTKTSQEKIPFQ